MVPMEVNKAERAEASTVANKAGSGTTKVESTEVSPDRSQRGLRAASDVVQMITD